jgi:AmmeMemoRadiSam system protein B
VAARAFAELREAATHPARVIVLGPAHRVPVEGLAVPRAFAFATPLGDIQLDHDAIAALIDDGGAVASDRAHAQEHSIEVQLPFLQETLGDFRLLPILAGYESAERIAEVLDPLLTDDTLLLVSTDLSHFQTARDAATLDRRTIQRIEMLATDLYGDDACGCCAVNALNALARQHGWTVHRLSYGNSADAGGPDDRVVGYAAFAYRAQ